MALELKAPITPTPTTTTSKVTGFLFSAQP
jgi:hypothetical protein